MIHVVRTSLKTIHEHNLMKVRVAKSFFLSNYSFFFAGKGIFASELYYFLYKKKLKEKHFMQESAIACIVFEILK